MLIQIKKKEKSKQHYDHILGESVGYCVFIKYTLRKQRAIFQCRCGKHYETSVSEVRNFRSKSCGCWSIQATINRSVTHGLANVPGYRSYLAMKDRCLDENCKAYKNYGGRGITICDRWLESVENFLEDMGERPSKLHSLDRINNEGNYEPTNCKWATKEEQMNNTRRNKYYEVNGESLTVGQISKKYNINQFYLYYNVKKEIPILQIIENYANK